MNQRFLSLALMILVGALTMNLTGCSSSTAPTTPAPGTMSGPTSTVELGNVNAGESHSFTVYIKNTGGSALTITKATVINAASITAAFTKSLPLAVSNGDSAALSLTFAPTAGGDVNGSVLVSATSSSDTLVSFAVHATGIYHIKNGNTYVYDSSWYDLNGGFVHKASFTEMISSLSGTFQGKTGCAVAVAIPHSTYYHFEANGNVSAYNSSSSLLGYGDTTWFTLPIATRETTPTLVVSGNAVAQLNATTTAPYHFEDSVVYVGSDTMTVNGQLLTLQHARFYATYTITGGNPLLVGTIIPYFADFYYSASIGFFARRDYNLKLPSAFALLGTVPPTRDNEVLTSFTLN